MARPTLIELSLIPSVSDQPPGHLDRSIVNPAGPVTVLPSADLPQPLSLTRWTIAARSLAHSASHASMLVGCLTVVAVAPPVVAAPPIADLTPSSMDWEVVSPSSPPPQAAASKDAVRRPAPKPPIRARFIVDFLLTSSGSRGAGREASTPLRRAAVARNGSGPRGRLEPGRAPAPLDRRRQRRGGDRAHLERETRAPFGFSPPR